MWRFLDAKDIMCILKSIIPRPTPSWRLDDINLFRSIIDGQGNLKTWLELQIFTEQITAYDHLWLKKYKVGQN